MLAAALAPRSIPTRSRRPNTPVFGIPSGQPMSASASSTEMPRSKRLPHRRLYPVNADAVGYETRSVLAHDDSFAEPDVGKVADGFDRFVTRFWSSDDFEELHVAETTGCHKVSYSATSAGAKIRIAGLVKR